MPSALGRWKAKRPQLSTGRCEIGLTARVSAFRIMFGRPDRPYLAQTAHPAVHGEAKGGNPRPGVLVSSPG